LEDRRFKRCRASSWIASQHPERAYAKAWHTSKKEFPIENLFNYIPPYLVVILFMVVYRKLS